MSSDIRIGIPLTIVVSDNMNRVTYNIMLPELKKLYKLMNKLIEKNIDYTLIMKDLAVTVELDKKGFEELLQDLLS